MLFFSFTNSHLREDIDYRDALPLKNTNYCFDLEVSLELGDNVLAEHTAWFLTNTKGIVSIGFFLPIVLCAKWLLLFPSVRGNSYSLQCLLLL